MSDIGFWELALIGVIGLLVMGPERLVLYAAEAGRWYGRLLRSFRRAQSRLHEEVKRIERDAGGPLEIDKSFSLIPDPERRPLPSKTEDPGSETAPRGNGDPADDGAS